MTPEEIVERAAEVIRQASGYHLGGHHIARALADAKLLWPLDEYDEIASRAEALQARLELSPADFDVQTRGRAFEEALLVAGLTDLARIIRVLTDMASGDCPLHGRHPVDVWSAATPEQLTSLREDPEVAALHEPQVGCHINAAGVWEHTCGGVGVGGGPPIDGHEVDRAPGPLHNLDDVLAELGIEELDDDDTVCHCGEPIYTHDEPTGFTRGLCLHCDTVRCDTWDGDCGRRTPLTPAQQIRNDEAIRTAFDNPEGKEMARTDNDFMIEDEASSYDEVETAIENT